jgi:hypothetical protein
MSAILNKVKKPFLCSSAQLILSIFPFTFFISFNLQCTLTLHEYKYLVVLGNILFLVSGGNAMELGALGYN